MKILCQSKSKDNIEQQNGWNPSLLVIPSLVYSFNKYLLSIIYEPDILLGTGDMMVSKSKHSLSCNL